jgi:hypothetical protein
MGVRWDLWPPIHEVHDLFTWLNPAGTNTNSGNLGTLAFAGGNSSDGYHTGVHVPGNLSYRNFAPRLGVAYAITPKTVIRSSYGLDFARGDWTSGSQSGSPNTLGLTPSASAAGGLSNAPSFYWDGTACTKAGGGNGTLAGDGFTTCGWTGSTASPTSVLPSGATLAEFAAVETATLKNANNGTLSFWDPHYGSKTPEYINWTFTIERQLTNDMSINVSYVGSEGHFLSVGSAMWQKNNKLPESYAALAGYTLTASGGSTQTPCTATASGCLYPILGQKATTTDLALAAADGFTPINGFSSAANYYSSNSVYQYYLPYPQYSGVSDTTSFVGNENWNALEISIRQRPAHGLNWMLNYTYSKSIDDLGNFRVYDNNRLDRSISAGSQPQSLIGTVVYALPLGRGHWMGDNLLYRAIVSDWTTSGIFSYHSGAPILVVASGCGGNSILSQCMPSIVSGQAGRNPIKYGKTASGAKASFDPNSANFIGNVQYINPAAFTVNIAGTTSTYGTYGLVPGSTTQYATSPGPQNEAYSIGNGPALYAPGNARRVSPLNTWGQGYVDGDVAVKRAFPVYREWKIQFELDMTNIANHVEYEPPGWTSTGSSSYANTTVQTGNNPLFGTITKVANSPRDVQGSLRISW